MILTNCAACAAPLGRSLGKKCGRCKTRYCGPECQVQHWKEGGHDNLCKPIKKAGGAEQYNANKKYTEAVAVAAEACAEDTKGQTCFICTQALHWKTKEGLVRGCACRGTSGFAHVSCLAEQAKILVAEAEENNLGWEVKNPRFRRWHTCSLCKQDYHGVVYCALGWACWKTYLGRPEDDQVRGMAMTQLGNSLHDAGHIKDAMIVQEAELSLMKHVGESEGTILAVLGNLAGTYSDLGRKEEALRLEKEIYSRSLRLYGEEHSQTFSAANNYALSLRHQLRYEEAKTLLRKTMPVAQRALGTSHENTIKMGLVYASVLYKDDGATLDDLREAVSTLEDTVRIARRVLGGAHPLTTALEGDLRDARTVLQAREDGKKVTFVRH